MEFCYALFSRGHYSRNYLVISLKTVKAKVASANLSSQSVLFAFACIFLSHHQVILAKLKKSRDWICLEKEVRAATHTSQTVPKNEGYSSWWDNSAQMRDLSHWVPWLCCGCLPLDLTIVSPSSPVLSTSLGETECSSPYHIGLRKRTVCIRFRYHAKKHYQR